MTFKQDKLKKESKEVIREINHIIHSLNWAKKDAKAGNADITSDLETAWQQLTITKHDINEKYWD